MTVDGAQVEVLVPAPEDIAPVGPFSRTAAATEPTGAGQVMGALASADVLLTLAALDPSLPSDYLRSWASRCVVVVTAGSSSWTKIHAVGELIRLAGMRLVSGVLVGADKWDESLGVTTATGVARDVSPEGHAPAHEMSFVDPKKSSSPGAASTATTAAWVAAEEGTIGGAVASDVEQPSRQRHTQESKPQPRSQGKRSGGGKAGGGRAQDADHGTSGGKSA